MKIKVTNQNIKHVAGLLRKALRNGFSDRMYYPASKRQNTAYKTLNLKNSVIEKSGKSVFHQTVVESDYMHGRRFIRIHNNLDVYGTDDEWSSRYRAFLVDIDDVVDFLSGEIHIRCTHPTRKEQKANQIIKLL